VLALRLAALRAGNQTLDGRLAELSLKQVISPAWAMIDPSQPPIWQRQSLSASKFAVGELRGSLAVALLEDTADAPVIWEPETATEHPVPTIKPDITGELVLTTLKNRPALIQVGHIIVAADALNGEVLGRASAPGRVAFLRRNGEAWLAEASPVHGAIWVRPLNSPDLWDSGSGNAISPSLAQRALEPVAVLPGKVRRLYPIETIGNPLIAAVDDQEDLFIIHPFAEPPFVVGPLIKVNNFASKPFDSEIHSDRPLLVVAVRDEQIAVAVLDGGTGERIAALNWTALDAAIDSAQSTSERREVEDVNFLNENGMPKLLIRTRWEDVLTTWDWPTGQLDVTVIAAGGIIKTARYAGQALVLVGSDSGLSVFDQARLRKQRRAQRGPACVIAAADVKGSALTSWLAPGHDGSSTLWTAADDGTEVDKMRLPGSDPEFVALGHVRGKPVAIALPDRNRGDCYLRWLDGSDQIYLVDIGTGWPDELADFALIDLSTVHDDSNLLWAGEFLSQVVDSRMSTDWESLLNSEFEASPGMKIAELVAVSAEGKRSLPATGSRKRLVYTTSALISMRKLRPNGRVTEILTSAA
jgi:hypothetical protein